MEISAESLAQTYASKSDDELIELHQAGALTEMAFDVIEAEMRSRQIDVPHRPNLQPEEKGGISSYKKLSLKAHWRGKAPLASAFWLVWIIGGFCTLGLLRIIEGLVPALLLVVSPLFVVYFVFAAVSVWRCAPNARRFIWSFLARLVVALGVVRVAIGTFVLLIGQ